LDLRLVRNQWLLLDPGAECLLSQINEDRTSGDFKEMGRRLANEVVGILKRKMDKYGKNGECEEIKLSFVGHSIGNIIIKSAITGNLQTGLEDFSQFVSGLISCFHLNLQNPNSSRS
jgi:hypothetical protein